MSKGGRYSKRKQPKARKSPVLTLLIVLVVILVLAVAGLVGVMVYQSFMDSGSLQQPIVPSTEFVDMIEEPEDVTQEPTTEPTTIPTTLPYKESGKDIINILLIGDSARKGETKENYHLADTMMLATVNKKTKTLTLTSFLRDTYVQLPAYKTPSGKNKINVAYHLGYLWGDAGGAMMKINECIKDNFGIEIDHNVEVNFEAFIDIVYELGGIEVELTKAEADYLNKDKSVEESNYTEGWTWLGGPEALSYARMRKAAGDGDSDIKRTARQRTVITELVKKVKGMSIEQAQNLLDVILPAVTTNMTNEEIKTCMWEILPILADLKIESGTAPVQGSYWSKDIGTEDMPSYALEYDKRVNVEYFRAITEGIVEEEPAKPTETTEAVKTTKATDAAKTTDETKATKVAEATKATQKSTAVASWDQILWKVNSAEKESTLTIDLASYTYVTNNILKAAQNRNITLIIQWDGGEDITVKPTDEIDLTTWRIELSGFEK